MAYGYDCTSSQSLNSAQGVKCLWLLMHLVSVAELTRGLCLHMWTHPLSTSQCSVSFSGAAGMVLAFRGAARTLRDLYATRLWLLNSEKMPKPATRLLMLSRCLCAPGVPPPAWFHQGSQGSQELLCHENQPYVGTIRIITHKAHSWSEQKHLVALPKKMTHSICSELLSGSPLATEGCKGNSTKMSLARAGKSCLHFFPFLPCPTTSQELR